MPYFCTSTFIVMMLYDICNVSTIQILCMLYYCRWYTVNYDAAEALAWGRNAGCRFAHGSCGEVIETRSMGWVSQFHLHYWYVNVQCSLPSHFRGQTLTPFCNRFANANELGCTVDRLAVSFCNLIEYSVTNTNRPPPEFQVHVHVIAQSSKHTSMQLTCFLPTSTLIQKQPVDLWL